MKRNTIGRVVWCSQIDRGTTLSFARFLSSRKVSDEYPGGGLNHVLLAMNLANDSGLTGIESYSPGPVQNCAGAN